MVVKSRVQLIGNDLIPIQSKTLKNIFSRVHATLQPALSVRPSVGPSIGPPILHALLFGFFFAVFNLTAAAQMMMQPQIWTLPTCTRLR